MRLHSSHVTRVTRLHEPRYLGCDDPELPSDYTVGSPEEPN